MPPIAADVVAEAIRSIATRTAAGEDGIDAPLLKGATQQGLLAIAGLFNQAERERAFPPQCVGTRVCLQPKPSGDGLRPIGLLSLLYRLWGRCRSPILRAFEKKEAAPWDAACGGSSAFSAIYDSVADDEVVKARGLGSSTLLVDIETFYDSIRWTGLCSEASRLRFPATILAIAMEQHMAPRTLTIRGSLADPIVPTNGVVAGCTVAPTLAKIILLAPVSAAVQEAPALRVRQYVDDLTLKFVGTWGAVLVRSAEFFAPLLRNLETSHFVVSTTKTILITSPPKLASHIAGKMALSGFPVPTAKVGKDLGVTVTMARRRRTTAAAQRADQAAGRARILGRFA